jgi:hypothetical protein
MDAHNCFPYNGRWADRVQRALAAGAPLAIENDLGWYTDPQPGKSHVLVVHERPYTGKEPTLRDYFFETVRPIVEKALKGGNTGDWPLITLNINDLRADDPALFTSVWDLLGEYEAWLCTAPKPADPEQVARLDVKPILVLTNSGASETKIFHDQVPIGGKLRLFGSGDKGKATNFRRWVNYAWRSVEPEGQPKAGDWTPEDAARLKALVDDAHARGYWIRFYTLNGHPPLLTVTNGWGPGYNFGSLDAVTIRWKAAIEAGVDFIASDQYEDLAEVVKAHRR